MKNTDWSNWIEPFELDGSTFIGEDHEGVWELDVYDGKEWHVGKLRYAKIRLHCDEGILEDTLIGGGSTTYDLAANLN